MTPNFTEYINANSGLDPLTLEQIKHVFVALDGIGMKQCFNCGEVKPLDEFHQNGIKARLKDRLRPECKACIRNAGKARNHQPTDKPKVCTRCGGTKAANEFHKDRRSSTGRKSSCIKCTKAYTEANRETKRAYYKAYYKTNKGRIDAYSRTYHKTNGRANKLKQHYNLTPEAYEAIFQSQGGVCAICGTNKPNGRGWHTDHDHSCCPGKRSCGECVRGVLCQNCNHLLGNANDDVSVLESAILYLKSNAELLAS